MEGLPDEVLDRIVEFLGDSSDRFVAFASACAPSFS